LSLEQSSLICYWGKYEAGGIEEVKNRMKEGSIASNT